jgi:hypothetical protein
MYSHLHRVLRAAAIVVLTGIAGAAIDRFSTNHDVVKYLVSPAGATTPPLFLSYGISPDPSCEEVAAWIEVMGARLPTTLAAISKYPVAYRRAIYGTLTSAQRVAVWREHLESFLSSHEALSPHKQLFVILVMERLDVLLNPDDRDSKALRELQARATEVLGPDLSLRVMANLGPIQTSVFGVSPSGEAGGLFCSCSSVSDTCPNKCHKGGCIPVQGGCGMFWLFSCDGYCEDEI